MYNFLRVRSLSVYFVFGLFVVSQSQVQSTPDITPPSNTSEAIYLNFLKVLMGTLIRKPPVDREISESLLALMKEIMNDQPEKDGYKSYLTTSMLRVLYNPVMEQVNTMLRILEESSPPSSQTAKSSKNIREFLSSSAASDLREEIPKYVSNLFEATFSSNHQATNEIKKSSPLNIDSSIRRRPLIDFLNF